MVDIKKKQVRVMMCFKREISGVIPFICIVDLCACVISSTAAVLFIFSDLMDFLSGTMIVIFCLGIMGMAIKTLLTIKGSIKNSSVSNDTCCYRYFRL